VTNERMVRDRKGLGYLERKFQGPNCPCRERMVRGGKGLQGLFVLGNESSRERTVKGTNVPENEWSRERKFHHGNECSRERKSWERI